MILEIVAQHTVHRHLGSHPTTKLTNHETAIAPAPHRPATAGTTAAESALLLAAPVVFHRSAPIATILRGQIVPATITRHAATAPPSIPAPSTHDHEMAGRLQNNLFLRRPILA